MSLFGDIWSTVTAPFAAASQAYTSITTPQQTAPSDSRSTPSQATPHGVDYTPSPILPQPTQGPSQYVKENPLERGDLTITMGEAFGGQVIAPGPASLRSIRSSEVITTQQAARLGGITEIIPAVARTSVETPLERMTSIGNAIIAPLAFTGSIVSAPFAIGNIISERFVRPDVLNMEISPQGKSIPSPVENLPAPFRSQPGQLPSQYITESSLAEGDITVTMGEEFGGQIVQVPGPRKVSTLAPAELAIMPSAEKINRESAVMQPAARESLFSSLLKFGGIAAIPIGLTARSINEAISTKEFVKPIALNIASLMLMGTGEQALRSGKETVDVYAPYGSYAQIKIPEAKVLMGYDTGEISIYQKPAGHSIFNLVSGGGRAAVQSGAFTIEKPETPYVVEQERIGTYELPSGVGMSRLGAEAYGGRVQALDSRTLSEKISASVFENLNNLANFVNPQGANLGKATAPGARIPWSVSETAPAVGYFEGGIAKGGGAAPAQVAALEQAAIIPSLRETGIVTKPRGDIFGYEIPWVSPALAFFQPETRVTKAVSETQLPSSSRLVKTEYSDIPGVGRQEISTFEMTDGKSVTTKSLISPIEGSSGYDQLNKAIREGLNLPSPAIGERAMAISSLAIIPLLPLTLPGAIQTATTGKETTTQIFNPFAGTYSQFYKEPLLTPISYGAGVVFGTGVKGVTSVYARAEAIAAPRIISTGQTARAADIFGNFVMANAPKALAGLYAVDVGARATQDFTNLAPESILPKTRGIVMMETVPMAAGFNLPGEMIKSAQLAEIGYKSAIQEGTATGRLEYYVKEPLTRPLESARIDYKSFVQESKAAQTLAEIPREPGISDYLRFKGERAIGTARISIKSTAQEIPGAIRSAGESLYGTYFDIKVKAPIAAESAVYTTVGKAYEIPKIAQSLPEAAYSKYFETRIRLPGEITKASVSTAGAIDTARIAISQGPGIAIKSFMQERLPARILYLSTVGWKKGGQAILSTGLPPAEFATIQTSIGGIAPPQRKGGGGITGTRTIGGRITPALEREPSLKSMGISEGRMEAARANDIIKSTDFRGKPASETMKPWDLLKESKQAAGVSMLTEQLPKVEGMPETRIAQRPSEISATYPFMLTMPETLQRTTEAAFVPAYTREDQRAALINVIEPSLEFAETQRKAIENLPLLASLQGIGSISRQSVLQVQEQEQFARVVSTSRSESTIRQMERTISDTASLRDYERIQGRITTPESRQRISDQYKFDIVTDTRLKTDIRQDLSTRFDLTQTPFIIPTITPITLPTFGGIPGGGGAGVRRGFKFTEYLSFVYPVTRTARTRTTRTAPKKKTSRRKK